MKTLQVKLTGLRPIIMGNPQGISLTNQYSVNSRRISSAMKTARKKGDESRLVELQEEQSKNDFFTSAYWTKEDGFYLPDSVVEACFKEAGRTLRKGRDVDRAVLVSEMLIVLKTGHRFNSLEDAYAHEAFRMEGPCKIPPKTGALIWKTRCMIPAGWTTQFQLEFDETTISAKILTEIVNVSGQSIGIGGWRPKFGRFTAEVSS